MAVNNEFPTFGERALATAWQQRTHNDYVEVIATFEGRRPQTIGWTGLGRIPADDTEFVQVLLRQLATSELIVLIKFSVCWFSVPDAPADWNPPAWYTDGKYYFNAAHNLDAETARYSGLRDAEVARRN